MLRNEDLDAAVKAGVITPEQQKALEQQAAGRRAARPFVAGRDERFRFLRGFNDVFLTLGVLLVTGAFLTQWSPYTRTGGGVLLAGALTLWLISEVLVGRYKAVLPGMAAVLGIGVLVSLAVGQWALVSSFGDPPARGAKLLPLIDQWAGLPFSIWLQSVGAGGLAILLYYIRFRLPFALLPLGLGVMATVLFAILNQFGLSMAPLVINSAALLMGLATFALAMWYDGSDPERLTRRSDCGFWLHLAAEPFIVHPVISLLASHPGSGSAVTFALVAVMGIVALAIDRRALLVSSLSYLGIAVGYLVRTAADAVGGGLTATLAILGAFVIIMGLGWHPLRRLVLAPFAGARWLQKLPPVQA